MVRTKTAGFMRIVLFAAAAVNCGVSRPLMPLAGGEDSGVGVGPMIGSGGAGDNVPAAGGIGGGVQKTGAGGVGGPGGPGATGENGGAGGGGRTPGVTNVIPVIAQALCGRPLGARLPVTSIPDMQQTLHRSWVLCSPLGLFRRPQAGITIGPDDRWAYLAWSGDQLVAQHGLDQEGSVEYIDTSQINGRPTIQVNFVNDLDFTITAAPPIISDDPRIMLINNNGVDTYTYAAVP